MPPALSAQQETRGGQEAADRQEADALLDAAAAHYREIRSLCAHFQQQLEVVVLGRTVRSSGELCQQQPAYFSMAFSDPEGDRVVADGEWLWIHYPSTDPRQVLRTPMDRGLGRFDFAREFLDRASERYRASLVGREEVGADTPGGPVEAVVLDLEPMTSAPFVHARLWVDPERLLLVRVRTEEANGSIRTVDLSDIRLNPEVDPEIFRFVPPDGADVITRGP